MAQDTIALVTDRLVNDGVGADGKKFPLYSENKLKDETSKKLFQNQTDRTQNQREHRRTKKLGSS